MKLFLVFFFLITVFFAGCNLNRRNTSASDDASNIQNTSAENSSAEVSDSSENVSIQTSELSFEELQELAANQNMNASEADPSDALESNTNTSVPNGEAEGESITNISQTAQNNPETRSRDEQRVNDIKTLQTALQAHFESEGFYPETLDLLAPRFVKELPKNPTPGGHDYVYTPIGSLPAQFYDLSYELEVGTDEVSAGTHVATPKGLAQP